VNNKELRKLRVSDSRLDNSYRALIEALRPTNATTSQAIATTPTPLSSSAQPTVKQSLSSSYLTIATGSTTAVPSGSSPTMLNRRLKEWQLEYHDDEGDRITVTVCYPSPFHDSSFIIHIRVDGSYKGMCVIVGCGVA
jgi:hypothetical protein